MEAPKYGQTLRAIRDLSPTAVVDSVADLAQGAGAVDAVLYLADFEQSVLLPIPDRAAHVELPVGQPVESTPAGEAFIQQRVVVDVGERGAQVWAPVVEGADCTGVLGLTLTGEPDAETLRQSEELGLLAGAAIALAARSTDLYNLVRRRKAMSLPASLQWDLLPPLQIRVPGAVSFGLLEPAYDVGGDTFDHAVNGFLLEFAVMDAMGHGLRSSALSSLTVGTYRHDRREGQPLRVLHAHLDAAVTSQYEGDAFVTGQIGRLDLRNGRLSWLNAGHPAPLLIRDGKVAGELPSVPSLPWGLGGPLEEVSVAQLLPGDSVLLYTDGVTEGRDPSGASYGLDGLTAAVEAAASAHDRADTIVRQLIGGIMDFQDRRLRDDATMLWVTWDPANSVAGTP
jgi:serine phosphatase RsbU (regulator of sigma subunit)